MSSIGSRIKALRKAHGLSQVEAAKRMQITQPSLSDIENGKTVELRGPTLAHICKAFHTTAEYVVFGTGESGDEEEPLIEAELLYMARRLDPVARAAMLHAARGIFNGASGKATPVQSAAAQADRKVPKAH